MTKKVSLTNYIDVGEVNDTRVVNLAMTATSDERLALAKELEILEVKNFSATLKALHAGGSLYRLSGRIKADVVQACSVALTPVDEQVDETFDEMLTTDPIALVPEEEFEAKPDTPVDLIKDDRINTGEIFTQWLALSLDPYPRSDAPVFEYLEDADSAEGKQTYSPFKFLENLKDK